MDNKARLLDGFRSLAGVPGIQVYRGEVTAVDGNTCSVALYGTDLVIDGVLLRADDVETGVLVVPITGSQVLVGCIENEVSSLYLVQVAEVEKVTVIIEDTAVSVSADGISAKRSGISLELTDSAAKLVQDQASVVLESGKISIKNGATNLKSLFDDLTSLLQQFQVTCAAPGSPSVPFPASVAQVVQLQTKVATILK